MKASNSFVPAKRVTFSAAITSDAMQGLINKSLGSQTAAARFTSTLISAVSSSEQLKNCEPGTIVAAALRGEGMGLIYGHGYYLVPYGETAQYQLSYKGMLQLAISTGFYDDIDCTDVREGEYYGRDRRTGKSDIRLDTYETDEERNQHPIIGYYAYFLLKSGSFRYEYWNLDKLLKHADRYSPAFKLEKYNDMINGKLKPEEVKKLMSGTPWYDVNGGQERMCKKTVLRQLLNSGYAPLSSEVKTYMGGDVSDGSGDDYAYAYEPQAPMIAQNNAEAAETATQPTEGEEWVKDTPEEKIDESAPEQPKTKKTQKEAAAETAEKDDLQESFFEV